LAKLRRENRQQKMDLAVFSICMIKDNLGKYIFRYFMLKILDYLEDNWKRHKGLIWKN